jgi:hypothetical protein
MHHSLELVRVNLNHRSALQPELCQFGNNAASKKVVSVATSIKPIVSAAGIILFLDVHLVFTFEILLAVPQVGRSGFALQITPR